MATIIFELSYVKAVINEPVPSFLVLFITILPQISISLLYEDELSFHSSWNIKKIFYFANLLLLMGGIFSVHTIYGVISSISQMLLIYLVLRVGKECMYVEYMVGKVLLILLIVAKHLFFPPSEKTD